MISTRDGDWWITTPLYVGDTAAQVRMSLCDHVKYDDQPGGTRIEDTEEGKIEMELQKCAACGATRVRYRWLDPERNRRA